MNPFRRDVRPKTRVKRAWIEATITRADGTVEHLGVIADSRPPSLLSRLKGLFR